MGMIKGNKLNEYNKEVMVDTIVSEYFKSGKSDFVIAGIGTDKCIGDCLGPLVGTILEHKQLGISVWGTLDNPIHAANMHKRLAEMYEGNKDGFIIGIDACLGDFNEIGDVQLREKPIRPGKGVGKKLPDVGILSMVGIVADTDRSYMFTEIPIRLSFIVDLANIIVSVIEESWERINLYKNSECEVAIENLEV